MLFFRTARATWTRLTTTSKLMQNRVENKKSFDVVLVCRRMPTMCGVILQPLWSPPESDRRMNYDISNPLRCISGFSDSRFQVRSMQSAALGSSVARPQVAPVWKRVDTCRYYHHLHSIWYSHSLWQRKERYAQVFMPSMCLGVHFHGCHLRVLPTWRFAETSAPISVHTSLVRDLRLL